MPMDIKFTNLDIVIRNIKAFGGGAAKHLQDTAVDAINKDVMPIWIAHISLADHTLAQLAKLGYPYSTRYGADAGPHPDEMVHIQSGDLLAKTAVNQIVKDGGITVQLTNTSEHYVFLRFGTSVMRVRDPAGTVMSEALPAIKKRFGEAMRGILIEYIERS
jgi:hypothetical protein